MPYSIWLFSSYLADATPLLEGRSTIGHMLVMRREFAQKPTIGPTSSSELLWNAVPEPAQPSVTGEVILPDETCGLEVSPSTNIDLFGNTSSSYGTNAVFDHDITTYASNMQARERLDPTLACIGRPQALPVSTSDQESTFSTFSLLDMAGPLSAYNSFNTLNVQPAPLEPLNSSLFQPGYSSLTDWSLIQAPTPNLEADTISSSPLHYNVGPSSEQSCRCPCRSRGRSIPRRAKPPYPSFAPFPPPSDQEEPSNGHAMLHHRQRIIHARSPTLSYPLTNMSTEFPDSSPRPLQEVVATASETAEEQEKRNQLPISDEIEDVLRALDNRESDEYVTSLLMGFLQSINVNGADTKDSNSRNQGKGPQVYTCLFNHCGKRLERKDRALGHVRMHFGYRPYVCNGGCGVEGCKDAFACHSYLKSHKQRPKETCSQCGASIFRKNFARHALLCPLHETRNRQ
ncbi:hypothetical protein FRC14_004316 [Serendipita sp. 396]|nr:hypothetical protein FRC14_004316 [Serendipita sp. 396]